VWNDAHAARLGVSGDAQAFVIPPAARDIGLNDAQSTAVG